MNHAIRSLLSSAVLGALATHPLAAQIAISDTNVSYFLTAPSSVQSDSVAANFTANAAQLGDALFEHWWYYRIPGDADESVFRDDGSFTMTGSGSHGDADWGDLDARGLLSAALDVDVVSTGATSGVVVSRMTLTNISGSDVVVNLFHYADIDVCGFSGNSATGSNDRHAITNPVCSEVLEFYGPCTDRFKVGGFGGDELGLRNGAAGDLDDTGLPFSGDHTAAFQWQDRTLVPGESATFTTTIAHNDVGCPAVVEFYGSGLAGAAGVPTISSSMMPIMGTSPFINTDRFPFPTTVALIKGKEKASLTFGPWTLLVGRILGSFTATAPGAGGFPITIPVTDRLCGRDYFFQWYGLDSGNPTGVSHSRGMKWIVGKY